MSKKIDVVLDIILAIIFVICLIQNKYIESCAVMLLMIWGQLISIRCEK